MRRPPGDQAARNSPALSVLVSWRLRVPSGRMVQMSAVSSMAIVNAALRPSGNQTSSTLGERVRRRSRVPSARTVNRS